MEWNILNNFLAIVPVLIVIYFYKFKKNSNGNREWRENYFKNFNFKTQSKEIDVTYIF
jgi:hypothetical protein